MGEKKAGAIDEGAELGRLTEFLFDASERELTLTFEPGERYSLVDVEGRVERFPGNCSIHDFEDSLLLWEIPHTRRETFKPLVA